MSTVEKTQIVADLRATADLIQKNGLTKNVLFHRVDGKEPPECPVCSMGGINVTVWGHPSGPASDQYGLPYPEFEALSCRQVAAEDALASTVGARDGIPTWNDAPERTQEEVIAAFRAAADALEAAE